MGNGRFRAVSRDHPKVRPRSIAKFVRPFQRAERASERCPPPVVCKVCTIIIEVRDYPTEVCENYSGTLLVVTALVGIKSWVRPHLTCRMPQKVSGPILTRVTLVKIDGDVAALACFPILTRMNLVEIGGDVAAAPRSLSHFYECDTRRNRR